MLVPGATLSTVLHHSFALISVRVCANTRARTYSHKRGHTHACVRSHTHACVHMRRAALQLAILLTILLKAKGGQTKVGKVIAANSTPPELSGSDWSGSEGGSDVDAPGKPSGGC
jgi:hypothetical protein